MKAKQVFFPVLKLILLTIILFFIYTIATSLAGISNPETNTNSSQSGQDALIMLAVCFLQTVVIAYPILRSRWTGWRLVLTIFVVFYGVSTFLSQIESIVFLKYLVSIIPEGLIGKLFIEGLIVAGLFAPLAVLILGKMRRPKDQDNLSETGPRLPETWPQWLWRLGLIAIIYIIIYISFGFFVAWQSPAVREYYTNLQMPSWILPFQFLRGLIWAGLAVPVIAMMKGKKWEATLAVALIFSVLMGILLLFPDNPIMPDAVRMAHFKEIMSSNFLFGCLVVLILHPGSKDSKSRNIKTLGMN
jgi:hypothetical protein